MRNDGNMPQFASATERAAEDDSIFDDSGADSRAKRDADEKTFAFSRPGQIFAQSGRP